MKTSYDIIIKPIISEQSMEAVDLKKYAFKVDRRANKTEIKKAVEEVFGVKVAKVNTVNYEGKMKRRGATQGRRSGYKKAIVTLTPDSKSIEYFESLN